MPLLHSSFHPLLPCVVIIIVAVATAAVVPVDVKFDVLYSTADYGVLICCLLSGYTSIIFLRVYLEHK